MKVVVATQAATGHVYPMMPLAVALRAAGHEVIFTAGGDFAGRLRAWGTPPGRWVSPSRGRCSAFGRNGRT